MNKLTEKNKSTRRKFFFWGLGIFTSITALRFILPRKKKGRTIKLLSEDGKLVEVDADLIKKTGVKVEPKNIPAWVKNKPTI